MSDDMKFRWIKAVTQSGLHDTTKLVALALWNYTNQHGGNAFPGHKTIASDLGKSERTVKTHMAFLRDGGWIARTSESNSHPHRDWADVYVLIDPDDRDRVQAALHAVESNAPEPGAGKSAREIGPGATCGQPGANCNGPGATCDQPGATHVAHQQAFSSSIPNKQTHHSDSNESGSSYRPTMHAPEKLAVDEGNLDSVIDWINGVLSQEKESVLGDEEELTVWRLWESDRNYRAILNKIRKDRRVSSGVGSAPRPVLNPTPGGHHWGGWGV